ncbi:acyl-CoA dehydrogenase C-terminal domain-containing protein [Lysobacter soyae]|uniref:Acyl-CoA dehydrogenase C-terminal domain-containing protein n=1 Tax=Lysobacter soyae TaxID=2764185 RepID=A0ABX8WS31_9GAMM|nr:acyl-CoA dehydrogenase C-terminal domain-containing protein [Lysobacter sp. CJ11]QYR53631.1 acyl-CoA dehydrogenase C-terminal domain-containing protein [Lysobacter sp. CJ11]
MSNRYRAPVDDLRFALFDVLNTDKTFEAVGKPEVGRELVDAILDEAARFTENVLAPLNSVGDEQGCTLDTATGAVKTPEGFKAAYEAYVENGWAGLSAPEEFGGQGMPHVVGAAVKEMIDASNLAWSNFPLLSHGAMDALQFHGNDWMKETFLKPLVSGLWTGTMCLTEPHAGTDLGLLKTRAVPNEDGTYTITGTKIFITAGEHDLTENIIHLVLAKLPDAPEGSRGISLFIVPKYLLDDAGKTTATPNHARCGALEHKMGIHGSSTCVMNFDGSKGYLVGQANKGLMAMFTMMNSARLGVGIQGLSQSERAYQNALNYARERLQMRALTGPKFPDKPADPIIVHPDVRRMLLTQKALIEGGRVLALFANTQVDLSHAAPGEAERSDADAMAGFLTPIVKACLTEWGVECAYHAQQCFGGHGYIAEHGMEQIARDVRITTLYEGTTGIQALDLVGRKLLQLQGAGFKPFAQMVGEFCQANANDPLLAPFVSELSSLLQEWVATSQSIAGKAAQNPDEVGASAYDYLFYSGYICLAYFWARSVKAAHATDAASKRATAKLETARFYYDRILPRTRMHLAALQSGADNLMRLDADLFD